MQVRKADVDNAEADVVGKTAGTVGLIGEQSQFTISG